MTGLRWVLLALGLLMILGVYLWGRGLPQRWLLYFARLRPPRPPAPTARVEPAIEVDQESRDLDSDDPAPDGAIADEVAVDDEPLEPLPERVVTLRFMPREGDLPCDRVLLALRSAGLRHGRYGIFHRHADDFGQDALFSVANLTEPGSFDLAHASETRIPGMSFFMVLPGSGDPVERFDSMVSTAKDLAEDLNGELRDEKGSSWSIQRERYVREEIIGYRHVLERSQRP